MAVIYGLNYFGSSLVGPTWACAPGMQTLAACRASRAHWKGGGKGGGRVAGVSLAGGGARHPRGRQRGEGLPWPRGRAGSRLEVECPLRHAP